MAVNLTKGMKVNLTKDHPGTKRIRVACGWKSGLLQSVDCDSAIIAMRNGKFSGNDSDICYYRRLSCFDGAIRHHGDDLVGGNGKNVNEVIDVELYRLPSDVTQIVAAFNIFDAISKKQNFGKVKHCFILIQDADTNETLIEYEVANDFPDAIALIVGAFTKDASGEWQFTAIGQGSMARTFRELARS